MSQRESKQERSYKKQKGKTLYKTYKELSEKTVLMREVAQISDIVSVYDKTGYINRDEAVCRIIKNRNQYAAITAVKYAQELIGTGVPPQQMSNDKLINELQGQQYILYLKLAQMEETPAAVK